MTLPPSETPAKLQFDDEPGASRSKWIACFLGLALVGWMGSGFIVASPQEDNNTAPLEAKTFTVAIRESEARDVTKIFAAEGQAQPDRRAAVRAQASGEVVHLTAIKGATLNAGDEIARLSTRELEARVLEAEEGLKQAREDFETTQSLFERGVATATRLREVRADLASAEAQLAQAEEARDDTVIRAPFTGRLNALDLDIGSYVSAGTEIGTILDIDPLRIVIQVPQQALAQVREGEKATVSFITGEERTGTIEYVSRDADTDTRTFLAEIIVPNPEGEIASGVSAQVLIPTEKIAAHFISPAILSLSEDGRLGLKTIDQRNRVVFHEIVVERAERDGIWVSGLTQNEKLITIGQGFVSQGEEVIPVPEEQSEERSVSSVNVEVPGGVETEID
ncbi:efflux RND transporter periplasmic adaptor subunit [Celeribacter sp. ULVN23_4]